LLRAEPYSTSLTAEPELLTPPYRNDEVFPAERNDSFSVPDAFERHELTPREVAAAHNNFYEFLPGRGGPVWQHAGDYVVEPWKIEIEGECNKPRTIDLDGLLSFDHEERIYHFRCVERWAMNVPWTGFPLKKLLESVEPKSSAKFVRFESAVIRNQMPGVREADWYPWPYHEGLRIDEAMNDLAFVVTGVYGEPLLKQHGAPVRIAVPWKYGYKNPKAIVKIELVEKEPRTFWQIQPHEYGFLSNVNPFIPHPRWSQAESYWLDSRDGFPTPLFNGYERYVAELYPDEPRELQKPLRPGQTAR
jgi:sulfoxide reductase catalytic subunit YedY